MKVSAIVVHTLSLVILTERTYYQVEIHVPPPHDNYEIGSQVIFNCTATPMPPIHRNYPLRYRWYFIDRGSSYSSSTNTLEITIYPYDLNFGSYCLIYSNNLLLGQRRTTLSIKGILIILFNYDCVKCALCTQCHTPLLYSN